MPDETRIAEVLAAWQAERDAGGAPDPERWIREHPDIADELRARFRALHLLELVGTPPSTPAPEAPVRIGEYRILREVGRGGMGVVYEAEQETLGRRVALKVLYPSLTRPTNAVKRFQREARAAARLHHTNLLSVHSLGEENGTWYYAMDLVRGASLDRVLDVARSARDHEPPEPRTPEEARAATASGLLDTTSGRGVRYARIARMFAGLAEALHVAHEAGVVHRDMKPSNILLDEDGALHITDFGVARLLEESGGGTVTGELVGTPTYMSPEQLRSGGEDVDRRADVYSLGATLYEVLALRPPFEGRDFGDLYRRIRSEDPPRLRAAGVDVPKDLETVVRKALAKAPGDRYATAAAMAADLRAFGDGRAIEARPIGVFTRVWRWMKRRPRTVAGLGGLAVVLLVLGMLLLTRFTLERRQRQARQAATATFVDFLLRDLATDLQAGSRLPALQALGERIERFYEGLDPADLDERSSLQMAEALLTVAHAYEVQSRFADARAAYGRVDAILAPREEDPPSVAWLDTLFLARVKRIRRSKPEAALLPALDALEPLLARIERLRPDHPRNRELEARLLGNRGRLLWEVERRAESWPLLETARARFLEALAEAPDDLQRRYGLLCVLGTMGHNHFIEGDLDAAVAVDAEFFSVVAEGLTRHPHDFQLQKELAAHGFNFGGAMLSAGRFEDALDPARQAVEQVEQLLVLEPTFGWAREWRGWCYGHLGGVLVGLGRFEEARAVFERQLEVSALDEQTPVWALHHLGFVKIQLERFDEAAEHLEEGLRVNATREEPCWNDDKMRMDLALACEGAGDVARARSLYRELIERTEAEGGPHVPARHRLAVLLAEDAAYDEACVAFEAVLDALAAKLEGPRPSAWDAALRARVQVDFARCLLARGDASTRARAVLEDCIARAEALRVEGRFRFELGTIVAEAREALAEEDER